MKKLIIIAALVAVTVSSALAQGRVQLSTAAATPNVKFMWPTTLPAGVTTPTGYTPGAVVPTGSGIVAGLFFNLTAGETDFTKLTTMAASTTANIANGYFAGGNRTITGWSAGAISGVIKVWSTQWANFEAAYNAPGGVWAVTAVKDVTPTVSPTTAPYLPLGGTSANPVLITMTVNPVPEPSTMAIFGLGLSSLLIFRRRK